MSIIITWLPIIQDIGGTIALVVGAYVALAGLNTWKRQIRANADHDLARRVLIAVYKLRDAMEDARYISKFDIENSDYFKELHQKRFAKIDEAQANLDVDLLEAEAVWGDESDYRKSLSAFKTLRFQLKLAFQAYDFHRDHPKNEEKYQELYSILFVDIADLEKDQFGKEITAAVRKLENVLRAKLRLKNR